MSVWQQVVAIWRREPAVVLGALASVATEVEALVVNHSLTFYGVIGIVTAFVARFFVTPSSG